MFNLLCVKITSNVIQLNRVYHLSWTSELAGVIFIPGRKICQALTNMCCRAAQMRGALLSYGATNKSIIKCKL